MRFWTSFLCILLLTGFASAQHKKFVVTPNQEVVPLDKGTVKDLMNQYTAARRQALSSQCESKPIYGFYTPVNPINQNFGFYHKDVCGEWFVVPANGSIDTIYFHTLGNVGPSPTVWPGSMDSTVYFRVFTSNITPTQGPGIRPGPYRPPCTSWGYYVNTNDAENGVAAFPEDATPPNQTAWTPTNVPPSGVDLTPSFPPFGSSIWGLGGYPIPNIKPNVDIKVVMNDLAPLNVSAGDVIFISFRIPNSNPNLIDDATQDIRFEIGASDQNAPYPSRDWKFYEHDSGPSNCAGVPIAQIKRGWVPRGPLGTDDTLATACYDIWFAMTPTSNTPPQVAYLEQLHNTTSTDPQTFTTNIFDCDVEDTTMAGVQNAWVEYTLDSNTAHSVWVKDVLQFDGGDQYEYTLPGVNPTRYVFYKVVAEDLTGAIDSSGIFSYKVVTINDPGWYRVDTSAGCSSSKIASIGTAIDTGAWFLNPQSFTGSNVPHRGDDGTAGPFSLGGAFVYYGDTMHYAWVGVDGAIALSKTITDTIDVNSNGFATDGYDFPETQTHSRADTLHLSYMPKAFIAPYWADWLNKQDSPLAVFGKVRTYADANKFVTEWDSLGDFDANGATGDIEAFRVVLNKTDNSVEFQYDEIGIGGLDTVNLTGIQCDSNYHPQPVGQYPPYAYYNKDGWPSETHLHNGLCIHYVPVIGQVATYDGWNLLSVAGQYQNGARTFLFPTAVSQAFAYNNGYVVAPTLSNGPGYWVKFSGPQSQQILGRAMTSLDIPVTANWNMIGSISSAVPVGNITADVATGITGSSVFYYYTSIGGYQIASNITPGVGYWVRSNGSGNVHLTAPTAPKIGSALAELSPLSKITFSQKTNGSQTLYIGAGTFDASKYDMPPRAPEGSLDVRFASNRMVETYPSVLDESKKYEYPIVISATQYPLTVKWQAASTSDDPHTLTLKTEDGKILAVMTGSGKITLNDASIKKVMITVSSGVDVPKVFSLSRNYPNPFNPTTRFTVGVPRLSTLEVSVYDVLGRKIATIWNGEQTAGYHTMEWDGRDGQGMTVPTGMYFIRANAPADEFSAVQKVMLMK